MHIDAFIDGRATPGLGGAPHARISPIDGRSVVGTAASVSVAQVGEAVAAAMRAQRRWRSVPVADRVAIVRAAIDDALDDGGHDGLLIAREMGKPAAEADGEFAFARRFAAYCGPQAESACAETRVEDDEGVLLRVPEPMGVVAAITPWNAPVILAALKVIPALMTGNAVVLKPSPLAPLAVTRFVADVAARLPAGVLNVVNGGPEVGEALVADGRVDLISFTGGPVTARAIGSSAARTITPTVMELGGNDAAVLLDDADWGPELAERIVFGAFLTSGQVCMAIKRVLVPRERHDAFVDELVAAAARVLRIGDPTQDGVTMGPVIDDGARRRLEALVTSARRAGGAVHELGSMDDDLPADGHWMRPVLVTGLGDDHELVREEQFGPVLPVLAYDDLDEAVARANGVEHGLASSVWSIDEEAALDVARRLRAGFTFINCANRAGVSLRAPMGGRGISGHGREFGDLGLAEYLQNHSVNYPSTARPGRRMTANRYPVASA